MGRLLETKEHRLTEHIQTVLLKFKDQITEGTGLGMTCHWTDPLKDVFRENGWADVELVKKETAEAVRKEERRANLRWLFQKCTKHPDYSTRIRLICPRCNAELEAAYLRGERPR